MPLAPTRVHVAHLMEFGTAIDIDAEERAQTKLQCAHIGRAAMKCRDPRVIIAKAAANRLNMAAAAGPSQLTNHDVAAVTRLRGGPKILANCAGLWLRGSV